MGIIIGIFIGGVFFYIWTKFFVKNSFEVLYKEEILNKENKDERILILEKEKSVLEEKINFLNKELESTNEKLTLEFKNIANEILSKNSKEFVSINENKIKDILNPLKEKIYLFEKKVEDTYSNEIREKSSLKTQIENLMNLNKKLSLDAENLTKALKGDSKTQGDWGEVQLEMILEKAGLEKDIHYTTQDSFDNKDEFNKKYRTDFIVKLPDNKNIIIDSKVSLTAYNNYFNEENEILKKTYLKQHLDSINTHIKQLSEKKYQNIEGINSPDYVFMFLPIEPAFWLALKEDTTLIEKALNKNIILVSVTNLLATLRIISMIWKQENQRKNVLDIAKEGGALYDKFSLFLEDMEKVGRSMDTSKNAYAEAMKKLYQGNGNIIKRTENLKKLGAKTTKQIEQKHLNRLEE